MTIDEAERIIASSRTPLRAEMRIKSRVRRELRADARRQKVSLKRAKEKRFMEQVEQNFAELRHRMTGKL